ncbi:MAG: hypothetical protein LBB41_04395, partial [Prevotellaceae bacterium]|nr:hypothetical protein [Prevotellaceae bacterium]
FYRIFLFFYLGVPIRVGLSATSPRGATLHYAPLRALRYYPSRTGSSTLTYYITFPQEVNHKSIEYREMEMEQNIKIVYVLYSMF